MHPLALLATEVATGTQSISTSDLTSKIPSNFTFTENMHNGFSSEEVRMLQILLNADSRTIVNSIGPGSAGNETTYFGTATQNAVERFQTVYRSAILDPIGYTSPTGIIGSRSRNVLNQILNNLRSSQPFDANIKGLNTIQNTGASTNNTSIFQSVNSGTTSLDIATTTASGTTTPLSITTNYIPTAQIGTAYNGIIEATGGTDSYTWRVLYGSLPNGITARTSVCITYPCQAPLTLSGNPTVSGSYTFIVKLSSGNEYITKEFVISIQGTSGTTTQQNTNQTTNQTTSIGNTSGQPITINNDTSTTQNSSSGSNIGAALGILGGAVAISALAKNVVSSSVTGTAAGGGVRTVFGGRITYVQYCTCTNFILLFIFDNDLKSIVQLLYIPGVSKLFQAYNVFEPGPQVLGGYIPGGTPCIVNSGGDCVPIGLPIGVIDTLRGVGTTLH